MEDFNFERNYYLRHHFNKIHQRKKKKVDLDQFNKIHKNKK